MKTIPSQRLGSAPTPVQAVLRPPLNPIGLSRIMSPVRPKGRPLVSSSHQSALCPVTTAGAVVSEMTKDLATKAGKTERAQPLEGREWSAHPSSPVRSDHAGTAEQCRPQFVAALTKPSPNQVLSTHGKCCMYCSAGEPQPPVWQPPLLLL